MCPDPSLWLSAVCPNKSRQQLIELIISLTGRGPYQRVAGGYTSTPKHRHEDVIAPRSLAVQLAASHPSPPTTPSPPPEDDEDKDDYLKDP